MLQYEQNEIHVTSAQSLCLLQLILCTNLHNPGEVLPLQHGYKFFMGDVIFTVSVWDRSQQPKVSHQCRKLQAQVQNKDELGRAGGQEEYTRLVFPDSQPYKY